MSICQVCGGALPEVALRSGDPFCSRPCAQAHHGTGDPKERARAARAHLEQAMEAGTDAATLELRRVTVDDRARLIAEGRYSEEFLPALAAWMIAHRHVRTETVTWFSPRGSGPTMRQWEEPETDDGYGSGRTS